MKKTRKYTYSRLSNKLSSMSRVANLMGKGFTQKEISYKLGITVDYVCGLKREIEKLADPVRSK